MIELIARELGKRFTREWIFKDFSYQFTSGQQYALVGANGSGKSTLIRCLIGHLPANQGRVHLHINCPDPTPLLPKHLALAAPYLELIDNFSLKEHLDFHFSFKNPYMGLELAEISEILELQPHLQKPVWAFSSGMKQRLKVGLALLTDCPLVVLDEPGTNLDAAGKNWVWKLVDKFSADRIVILASNEKEEIEKCSNIIRLSNYKP